MNKLVIDHSKGTYTVTKNGVQQSAPIKHPRTVKHIAGYFKHIGYSVYIIHRKGKTPMALTPGQQKEVNRNHYNALAAVKNGATKINGQTLKAMVNRGFVNHNLQIQPAGEEFYMNYQFEPEDIEPPTPAALNEVKQPVTIVPAAAPIPVDVQPVETAATDDPEVRETILVLRRAALELGRALAVERVPELRGLFEAIERSDAYLFKK